MYRSGWGTKPGQEYILALTIKRDFFEEILLNASWSSYTSERYKTHEEWKSHVQNTNVRLQWDPDHLPNGDKETRKAIQLGLKDNMLSRLNDEGIIEINNVNKLVEEQRHIAFSDNWETLTTPLEQIYTPSKNAAENVLIDTAKQQ